MLRATFQHLVRGISAEREAGLWKSGVLSWEEFERRHPVQRPLFQDSDTDLESPFSAFRAALHAADAGFFANLLHRREHFRIPLALPDRTVFLDIETTGLSRYYDIITLVGWSYKGSYGVFIRGQDESRLHAVLQDAQVIVTFNGSLFDLPFIRARLPSLRIPSVHIDLRFLARRVALVGGQKFIECALGFERPREVFDVLGETAPVLWHRYRRGSLEALRLLIEYNHCDVEGMKYIFDRVVARLLMEQGVPKPIRESVPYFAKPSKLVVVGGQDEWSPSARAIRVFPYQGPSGPAITLPDLSRELRTDPLRVVGVDLSGSENRPTGWCLLEGSQAVTRCLRTDEELIDATFDVRPHVVSIDSPLSLPRGRICVSDDDPGREEFGIMRHCERVLKRRGINVYPALIPSMQRLTARGIRLASKFRALGIPVIESYPGAAQDIMGIPRKRASLEMLHEGLAEFGVTGEYMTRRATHDELDAITAAVVGVFFWSGKFEALGAEDEEALVIPDLKADPRPWLDRRMVGISGPVAAGKTTAARHLESLGHTYARYSMVLEAILKAREQNPTRALLQEFGEEVHRTHGQRWLGRRLLESIPDGGNIVIDGLRFPNDHAFLAEAFGPAFCHVHVTAPENLRSMRFRNREDGNTSLNVAETHPVEREALSLASLAHIVISNADTLQSFQGKVDALVRT
jgi:uncharacterized protein YprB with RNaseH-like and TPR domain/predicted nuclease with RNAse H fold/dephospho-CoA kinase